MKIGIEGVCLAGKTTLIRNLTTKHPHHFCEIPEYVDVAGDSSTFPPFPPKNEGAAREAFNFFLNLESKRYNHQGMVDGRIRLLDRTIFTLLAFEYAARWSSGVDIVDWATDQVIQKPMWWPDCVVIIHIQHSLIQERKKAEGWNGNELLLQKEFNDSFVRFLQSLNERFGIPIHTIDGSSTQTKLQVEFLQVLTKLQANGR